MADGLGAKQRSGGRGSGAGQRGAGGVGTLRFWLSRTPLGRAALGRAASGPRPMLLAKPAHDPHRRLALLVLIPLAVATVAFGVLVLYKHVLGGGAVFQAVEARAEEQAVAERAADAADVPAPPAPSSEPAAASAADAGISAATSHVAHAEVRYISDIVDSNEEGDQLGIVTTPVALDGSWFAQDPDAYNHDLARACVALCAVVNAESAFYGGKTDVDFAGEALGALGFTDIRSDSYAKRSAASDEVAAIFTGSTDVTAYVFARKRLADGRDLVFVGIRGTYGSEWLSNFNLKESAQLDHRGFDRAEEEIRAGLAAYCDELGIDPAESALLVTGHSRGGAVANLLAAQLDAAAQEDGEGARGDGGAQDSGTFPRDGIYAYTFAAPNATQAAGADGEAYANIFNVVNSTDLVPRLPLEAWGWHRYGVTVGLPAPGDDGFAEAYGAMQDRRAQITGYYDVKSPFADADENPINLVEDRIARSVPSLDELFTVEGISGLLGALGTLNVGQLVASHYPDTYLAWMQTLDADQLAFG